MAFKFSLLFFTLPVFLDNDIDLNNATDTMIQVGMAELPGIVLFNASAEEENNQKVYGLEGLLTEKICTSGRNGRLATAIGGRRLVLC